MPDLRDAPAPRRVGHVPVRQRINVEVLAIHVDAPVANEPIEVLDDPAPGAGVAQVEKARIAVGTGTEQPLGVVPVEPGAWPDPLWLMPDDALHAARTRMVG